jgi:hypothetical protein
MFYAFWCLFLFVLFGFRKYNKMVKVLNYDKLNLGFWAYFCVSGKKKVGTLYHIRSSM